jgi:hypothetical protein
MELFFEDDNIGMQTPVQNIDVNTVYEPRYAYNRPYQMRDVAGEVGEYGQIPGQGNVDMYTPQRNIFSRAKNTLGKGITGAWDWGKALPGMAFSALSGIPGIGMLMGLLDPGKMRGYNYNQGRFNTQQEYEANRAARQQQSRVDNLMSRMQSGKSYSQKNLNELTMGSRPGFYGNRATVSNINRAKHNIGMPEHLGDRGSIKGPPRSTNTKSPGHPRNANPGSGGGIGSAAAGKGPAGGSIGASRGLARGGRMNRGGLARLL